MKIQLPAFRSAPPVRAWPLVQPRPSAAPKAMSHPPRNARLRRRATEARGPFSIVRDMRRARTPEKTAPVKTPRTSKTSQAFNGCPGPSR